jgi:hypothetical protein
MVTKPIHLFFKIEKFFADAIRQLPGDRMARQLQLSHFAGVSPAQYRLSCEDPVVIKSQLRAYMEVPLR